MNIREDLSNEVFELDLKPLEHGETTVENTETRQKIEEILHSAGFDLQAFQEWMRQVLELPEPLKKWLLSVVAMSLVLLLQGCMYTPRYGEVFRRSPRPLSSVEIQGREQQVRSYLQNPTPYTFRPALQGGIESFQQERILQSFEDLIQVVSREDFDRYLQLCHTAKTELGIMNPDRYDPDLLQAALDNYTHPELHEERQVIMAIIARKDRESIGGIQSLNVETHRLREFMQAYKVIVVETSSVQEILHHIATLNQRGILRYGKLKAVFMEGHGNPADIDVGLEIETLSKISRMNWYFNRDEAAYMVFASCNSGGVDSFADRAALLFPQTNIVACDGYVSGIHFKMTDSGKIEDDPSAIGLSGAAGIIMESDSSYRPRYERILSETTRQYTQKYGRGIIPEQYIHIALRAGLIDPNDIIEAFNLGTDPYEYRLFKDCGFGSQEIVQFRESNVHISQVYRFVQLNITSPRIIIQLVRNQISPEIFLAYLQDGVTDVPQMIYRQSQYPRERK
jgi:hypothetical protein